MMKSSLWLELLAILAALVASACLVFGIVALSLVTAHAHEIYTGLHGSNGQLCCGGDDCSVTVYRNSGSTYEFMTREDNQNTWVEIPESLITFLPVPGDDADYKVDHPSDDDTHRAHICYRMPGQYDPPNKLFGPSGHQIFLYCAFVPPGAI